MPANASQIAQAPSDKTLLLRMADTWIRLAEQAEMREHTIKGAREGS